MGRQLKHRRHGRTHGRRRHGIRKQDRTQPEAIQEFFSCGRDELIIPLTEEEIHRMAQRARRSSN